MVYTALLDYAKDGGTAAALNVAQQWQTTLESIGECGAQGERDAAALLLREVNRAIASLRKRQPRKRSDRRHTA